jgi:hypothetical protein
MTAAASVIASSPRHASSAVRARSVDAAGSMAASAKAISSASCGTPLPPLPSTIPSRR